MNRSSAEIGQLLLWRDAHQAEAGEQINIAVGALADVADARMAILEQVLLGGDAVAVQHQAHQGLGCRAAEELSFGSSVRARSRDGRGVEAARR